MKQLFQFAIFANLASMLASRLEQVLTELSPNTERSVALGRRIIGETLASQGRLQFWGKRLVHPFLPVDLGGLSARYQKQGRQ